MKQESPTFQDSPVGQPTNSRNSSLFYMLSKSNEGVPSRTSSTSPKPPRESTPSLPSEPSPRAPVSINTAYDENTPLIRQQYFEEEDDSELSSKEIKTPVNPRNLISTDDSSSQNTFKKRKKNKVALSKGVSVPLAVPRVGLSTPRISEKTEKGEMKRSMDVSHRSRLPNIKVTTIPKSKSVARSNKAQHLVERFGGEDAEEHTLDPNWKGRVAGYCVAEAYDLTKIEEWLVEQNRDPIVCAEVIAVSWNTQGFSEGSRGPLDRTADVHIFEYGAVVFWGLGETSEKRFLEDLRPFEINPYPPNGIGVERLFFSYRRTSGREHQLNLPLKQTVQEKKVKFNSVPEEFYFANSLKGIQSDNMLLKILREDNQEQTKNHFDKQEEEDDDDENSQKKPLLQTHDEPIHPPTEEQATTDSEAHLSEDPLHQFSSDTDPNEKPSKSVTNPSKPSDLIHLDEISGDESRMSGPPHNSEYGFSLHDTDEENENVPFLTKQPVSQNPPIRSSISDPDDKTIFLTSMDEARQSEDEDTQQKNPKTPVDEDDNISSDTGSKHSQKSFHLASDHDSDPFTVLSDRDSKNRFRSFPEQFARPQSPPTKSSDVDSLNQFAKGTKLSSTDIDAQVFPMEVRSQSFMPQILENYFNYYTSNTENASESDLRESAPHAPKPLPSALSTKNKKITKDPTATTFFTHNQVVLENARPDIKLAVSFGISQCTKMNVVELQAAHLQSKTRNLAEELQDTGHIASLSSGEISHLTGELYVWRNKSFLQSAILLDEPDFFWEVESKLKSVFRHTHKYFDMDDRLEILEQREENLMEFLDLLADESDHRISWRRNVLITVLVLFEVIMQIVKTFLKTPV